jgi:hypothetical protein
VAHIIADMVTKKTPERLVAVVEKVLDNAEAALGRGDAVVTEKGVFSPYDLKDFWKDGPAE